MKTTNYELQALSRERKRVGKGRTTNLVIFDRLALSGMAFGLLLMVQPWWQGGLKMGFFLSLVSTLGHIYTSRKA